MPGIKVTNVMISLIRYTLHPGGLGAKLAFKNSEDRHTQWHLPPLVPMLEQNQRVFVWLCFFLTGQCAVLSSVVIEGRTNASFIGK